METITIQGVLIFAFALILIVAIEGIFRIKKLRKRLAELSKVAEDTLVNFKKSVTLNSQFQRIIESDMEAMGQLITVITTLKQAKPEHKYPGKCKATKPIKKKKK